MSKRDCWNVRLYGRALLQGYPSQWKNAAASQFMPVWTSPRAATCLFSAWDVRRSICLSAFLDGSICRSVVLAPQSWNRVDQPRIDYLLRASRRLSVFFFQSINVAPPHVSCLYGSVRSSLEESVPLPYTGYSGQIRILSSRQLGLRGDRGCVTT